MKKILIASYSLDVGGIETALVNLLNFLNEEYEVTLALEKKEGIFLDKVPKNIKIITYTPSNNKNIIIRKTINYLKQLRFRIKNKNKYNCSISYATYSKSCSFMARTASRNSILYVHNNYLDFFNNDTQKYKNFFKDLKIDAFKKIVFVSNADQKIFSLIMPEERKKSTVCNNLIDYETIIKKSKEKIDDISKNDIPTFINIGRHDEKQKKITRIIKATKRLNDENYKFRVLLVGNGHDHLKYLKLANSLKIKNIYFLGTKENPYPYLKLSDCFVLSSNFEGYPVVFLESQILGKPIITTDISDAKTDIKDKYGLIVDKSPEGVYRGMKKFLETGIKNSKFDAADYNNSIQEKIKIIIEN